MSVTNFAIAFKFMTAKFKGSQNNSTESTNQALVEVATRGTAMVVAVSVAFLVLTAPSAVYTASYISRSLGNSLPFYKAFMNLTQYLNHSINGVLYCIVGSKFREELIKLFHRKKGSEMPSVNVTMGSGA